MTYIVKETLTPISGNPTLTSVDGTERANFRTILNQGRANEFDIYDVDTSAEDGKIFRGAFALEDGVPKAVIEDKTAKETLDGLPYKTAGEARLAMTTWINQLTGQIQNKYPDVIQKGWEDEEAMAAAFEAGTMTQEQTAILSDDAEAKGRTPAEHAARIVQKATAFRSIALRTRTLWLATDKALEAATDPSEYEGILATAIEQAAPLAAAYGLET